MFYSHDQVMQPGYITRLMACDHPEFYPGLDIGPTYVHPNYANPKGNLVNDHYAPYNKPGSLHHWLFENPNPPHADYVLVVEPDMVFRKPIDCEFELGVRDGLVASAPYDYLSGTDNGMAAQFIGPESVDRLEKVGGFYCFRMADLKRVVPLWLNLTKEVRKNPERYWKIDGIGEDYPTGDQYVSRGHAPWISEMYGYIFAAGEVGLRHSVREDVVLFSGLPPKYEPSLIHYGLFCSAGERTFNKLSYKSGFNVRTCGQYFPEPPSLESLRSSSDLGLEIVCVEQVSVLNEALCEYHRRTCCDYENVEFGCHSQQRRWAARTEEASTCRSCCSRGDKCSHYTFDEGTQECFHSHFLRNQCADGEFELQGARIGRRKVAHELTCPSPSWSDVQKMQDEENVMGGTSDCSDRHTQCAAWAADSQCSLNPGFMHVECPETCRVDGCWDRHYHCGQWADMGQCEENFYYMVKTCPAACRKRRQRDVQEHAAELKAAHEERRKAREQMLLGAGSQESAVKEDPQEEIAEEEDEDEEDEEATKARDGAEGQLAGDSFGDGDRMEDYRPARVVAMDPKTVLKQAERDHPAPDAKLAADDDGEFEVAWWRVTAAIAGAVVMLGAVVAACCHGQLKGSLRRTAKRAVFVKDV